MDRLSTTLQTARGAIVPVDDVSFELRRGCTLALVGESGSGKTLTALSILRLLPSATARTAGQVLLEGRDLLQLGTRELRALRGSRATIVWQDPASALNPVLTVGAQVAEPFRLHEGASRAAAWAKAVAMLERVRIPDAPARARAYPHELSGGMRQRVLIAMALACSPVLLIADEPTTGLDAPLQLQTVRLLQRLQREQGTAMLFITHDLDVVAEVADEVAVMYAGQIVEQTPVQALFERPLHPYTQGLLAARPRLVEDRSAALPTLPGLVPGLHALPAGCRFAPRCPQVEPICHQRAPSLVAIGPRATRVACHVAQREGERD